MIIVFPFFPGDQDLAIKNIQWMNELGGCKGHDALVIYDKRCEPGLVEQIGAEFRTAFDKVYRQVAGAQFDGWPQGANYFFRMATAWLSAKADKWPYFLWMEPDAIPLREGWLNAILEAHEHGKRPFTGDRVAVENIPVHMSGVGIYPNPLHRYAGEAYRASDTAWDMAGKDQIVPQANFTKLIEHAWRHPAFPDQHSIETQIRPEAVLFHSSKDGSLIDQLRSRKNLSKVPIQQKEAVIASPAPIQIQGGDADCMIASVSQIAHQTANRIGKAAPTVESAGAAPTCDIFIRTYPGDYEWLNYCLRSINKFCTGFRKIWIVSPQAVPMDMQSLGYEWKVMNEESDDHYLSQQIHKLYADTITGYEPDYILHVDSDVIFCRPCSPEDFFVNTIDGALKPTWPYTPYEHTETPWQPITEKFMDKPVANEFMRRFPIMIPKWLYPKLREYCFQIHKRIISEYIRTQPHRSFSEFNALGAFAWEYHHDKFFWANTLKIDPEPLFAYQYHSWSGLTKEVKSEIESFLNLSGGVESRHADNENRPEANPLMGADTHGQPKGSETRRSGSSDSPVQLGATSELSGSTNLWQRESGIGNTDSGDEIILNLSGGVESRHAGPNVANDQPSEMSGLREPVSPEASGSSDSPVQLGATSELSGSTNLWQRESAPTAQTTLTAVSVQPLVTADNLKHYIEAITLFSKESKGNRIRVGQHLSKAGLK